MNITHAGRDDMVTIGTRRRRRIAIAGLALLATSIPVSSAAAAPAAPASGTATSNGDGTVDTGSMSAISQITGAQGMWALGFTGAGVGVAVIDTGVARVPGLDRPGKVIDGPDLSFDSQVPGLSNTDAFGHGTHIAGIIAGSDVAPGAMPFGCATCTGLSRYTDTTKYVGIAPEAKIINVKVGSFDGTVDVSQVIAGINWVVQHRNDAGLNIRVLNLSFGTDSLQDWQIDPLVYAAEAAWDAGIVVVAAGGNDGEVVGPLANPAVSPSIIAVGSTDPMGTLLTNDDEVATFAQHGTVRRGIDISAPGVSVIGLRVADGFVDQNVTTGKVGTRFQRASGTSQSTAVVAGLAALILSKIPTATPDLVKTILTLGAEPMTVSAKNKKEFTGAGAVSLRALLELPPTSLLQLIKSAVPTPTTAIGTGPLEGARGSFHVTSGTSALQGEIDIFGQPWSPSTFASTVRTRTIWSGGTWNGVKWTANGWTNGVWSPVVWTATDWTGASWQDTDGDGDTSEEWSGARWSGARWSGTGWSGARWSGARWSGADWT